MALMPLVPLAPVDFMMSPALVMALLASEADSRETKPGDLFVAMTGCETDGHRFIPMALEKGAACVLCEKAPEEDVPCVRTSDSRAALARVGINWFAPRSGPPPPA